MPIPLIPGKYEYYFYAEDDNVLNHTKKGKYETALSAYKEVILIAPEVSQAYLELGNLLFSLGRVKETIQIFEKALEVDPQNQLIRNVLRQIKDKEIQSH